MSAALGYIPFHFETINEEDFFSYSIEYRVIKVIKGEYRVTKGEYRVIKSEYRVIKVEYRVIKVEYRVIIVKYRVIKVEYRVIKSEYRVIKVEYRVIKLNSSRGAYCVCRVHNMLLERAYCVGSILWLYNALLYLSRMEFPTLINWTGPVPFEGLLGGIFSFLFKF